MADTTRAPGATLRSADWQLRGACRGMNPEMFFHPEGERGMTRRERAGRAKLVCGSCPVLEACRSHSLAVHEPYGVWGGLTEEERVAVHAGRLPLEVAAAS